jgi:hypothetical protein
MESWQRWVRSDTPHVGMGGDLTPHGEIERSYTSQRDGEIKLHEEMGEI